MAEIKPFEVVWTEAAVGEVLDRVRAYPWPPEPAAPDGWNYGCDGAWLRGLCEHWTGAYDWRAAVADLNRFPQHTARVEDFDLHFLHVVGEAGGRRPLIVTHGWPGSHYEFWDSIEKLAFPSRFGGSAADAFDLVVPSLPGFGFSSKPTRPIGQRTTARLFNTLMTEVLGYKSYLAQGGDWGAMVTSWLGRDHGASARAIHLNMLGFRPHDGVRTDEERAWAAQQEAAGGMMGAYLRLQMSKPQSVAWLGAGNPVGQAAWICERFHDWSDLSKKTIDEAYGKDKLLTNIMIYVMTGSFTTGAWYYRGLIEEGGLAFGPGERLETPTAFANFPGEPLYAAPPRSFAERAYNVVRWTDMPRGGHFAAMEEPDLFVDEVRAWARDHG
ncbi:epoxide hydrolase family protein [Phenylobacterium sp.]|uniref:epoxide hydrolase family protein n=1 Tax=Phenylobacterium sp. TaxID=1871053 RepID=UPI0025CB9D94|nr:epoxide hydrolase family protein [Phenylobacterium sp.]MBX3484258.1 epoxide hydrolase [Phenylobacterium sp.]MCW5759392.1 epoxide hydrolase [Phenylobacterium sp.]